MAWGGERGVVVVDVSRRALLAALAPAALYHAPAPPPPAPPRCSERQRSPSLDQVRHTPPHPATPRHTQPHCARPQNIRIQSYLQIDQSQVSL